MFTWLEKRWQISYEKSLARKQRKKEQRGSFQFILILDGHSEKLNLLNLNADFQHGWTE